MNTVIRTIREHIDNQDVCFVFPSQTSAGLWARKICTLGIVRSVAANRYLAWDRFKEEVIRENDTKRTPASSVMRKLFADALIRKNAEAAGGAAARSPKNSNPGGDERYRGFPLKSLVPPEYAGRGGIFVPFIARLLPSLAYWEKLMNARSGIRKDGEDEDYQTVKREYAAFLERYGLFEPSWEEVKILEGKTRYVLFFPELIEDFAEYDALLEAPQFVRITAETPELSTAGGEPLLFYQSVREEIRSAVTELKKLHEEDGLPYEDMAISVPELEEMEPCLLREFALRHIPVTRRAGKKLGESGAGRLFSLVNECAASRFSFSSLKALILNDHIPWKEREKNKALISFGIRFNCVSSYVQDNEVKDIWEEAFKEAHNDGEKELRPYYRELKKRVLDLAGAESFSDIRKYYFAFRRTLLDMDIISEEDNAVLSRCIEELGSLIELEEMFNEPALVPASPPGFFLSCLGEKEYVKAGQKPGVNIFKWRVASAAPFACHFVLNASQSAASVLYQPMKFLRQDKRKALGLEDSDATGAFFKLCSAGQLCDTGGEPRPAASAAGTGEEEGFKTRTRISASAQTFSGWAIPHSFFAQGRTLTALPCPEDSYGLERRFWRVLQQAGGTPGTNTPDTTDTTGLHAIFPLQEKGYNCWKSVLAGKENNFSFFTSPVPSDTEAEGCGASTVRELLSAALPVRDGCLTVTPTLDLNEYYKCPLSWLYKRICKIKDYPLEAVLLDDLSLGRLYHKILEKLFNKIKDEDGSFDSRRMDEYKKWTLEITRAVIEEAPAFAGPLAVPLVFPLAAGISKKIAGLLEREAKKFDGYRVAELELEVSYRTGDILITGKIDRVSISPDGGPVIIDYKSSAPPKQTEKDRLDEEPLFEFQMPLYIKLYEEWSGDEARAGSGRGASKVQGACFYNINGKEIKTVVKERDGGKTKAPTREEYEPYLEAAEKQIEEFVRKVKALDFTPRKIRVGDCVACVYKTVCRSAYFLNREPVNKEKEI